MNTPDTPTPETAQTSEEEYQPNYPTVKAGPVIIIGLTLCVIISFVAALGRIYLGPDQENFAVRALFELVAKYVKTHEGAWPGSWDDLEAMPTGDDWYEPMNFELAKELVEIDFDADVNEIAKQTPDQFDAIRAKQPVFDYRTDPRVSTLIEIVRQENLKE